jgi:hypothetical protein
MIKQKKICKTGIGKALDFKGCGKETFKRTYNLCDSCLYDFYTTDERGKVEFAKRKIKVNSKREKAFKSDLRQKLKTLSEYEAEAKKAFQKWVRLRDEGLPCISCNNPNPKYKAGGHYYPAGIYSGLMFDERNCHLQCNTYCNKMLSGNPIEYRKGLIKRFGLEFVNQLDIDADILRNRKYTKDELIEIKQKFELLIKKL